MAKKVYIAEFDANADPYLRKLKGIETKTETMTNKVQGNIKMINTAYAKMAAGIAAVGIATNYLTGIIKAYGEEEKAIKRLDIALGKSNRTLTQYAATLQKITTYADDQILEAMALIANYVKEEAMVKKLTKATMDLATAKGMDLSTAAELVAKTIGSSTNALSRYGIEIDNNKKGIDRVNAVLEQFIIFQGQAEGEADTYSGKLQQMTNSFSDLEDSVAQGVLPTLNEFSVALTDLSNKLGSSGISELLDKYLKLLFIIPRTGLKGVNAIGGLFGMGSEGDDWTGSVGYASNYVKNKVLTSGTTNKTKKIGGGKVDDTAWQWYLQNITGVDSFGDAGGKGMGNKYDYKPPFIGQMQDVAIPELKGSFEEIGDSFVNKFSETQNIAYNIGSIFGNAANGFLSKMMQAFDVANSLFSIGASILNIASGGIGSLFGLAEGGTVINKNGKLSYTPIPKFARGGSYTVPAGYSNDSGLIRVQSGERVDVTPSSQVPMLGKLLQSIDSKLAAANINAGRKNSQSVNVTLKLDGKALGMVTQKNLNRLSRASTNLGEQ